MTDSFYSPELLQHPKYVNSNTFKRAVLLKPVLNLNPCHHVSRVHQVFNNFSINGGRFDCATFSLQLSRCKSVGQFFLFILGIFFFFEAREIRCVFIEGVWGDFSIHGITIETCERIKLCFFILWGLSAVHFIPLLESSNVYIHSIKDI